MDYKVYAVNPTTGQLLSGDWPYVTGFSVRSSPAVAADGTIYVGSYDGKIHAINPNGTPKTGWPKYVGGDIFSSPTIGPDGTVYFGAANSKVYAYSGVSGLAQSSWPMFRRNPRHFGNAASITLHSGEHWPDGVFQFSILASPALGSGTLEASTDFAVWSSLGSISLTAGSADYVDAFPSAQKFYRVSGADHRSVNPYGYVARTVQPGWSMIANQLSATNNRVRSLFTGVPNGTQIWKINEATSVDEQATFNSGVWSGQDFTLLPGEAARIYNPNSTLFTNTFVGEVLQGYLINPIPAGFSHRSSMVPQAGQLQTDLQFPSTDPFDVFGLTSSGSWVPYSFDPDGGWSPAEPILPVGYSFQVGNPNPVKNWTRNFWVW